MSELFNNLYYTYIDCSCKEHASRTLRNKNDYIFNIENIKCQLKNSKNDTITSQLLLKDLIYYKQRYEKIYKKEYQHDMTSCESYVFMKNYLKNN